MSRWSKGQSGNPAGRRAEKPFRDALKVALSEEDPTKKKTKLRVIADNLVEAAVERKEPWAIKEVIDRIDGKAVQEIDARVDGKRDASDWTREQLVEFLNNARDGSDGAAKTNGSGGEADTVH